MDIFEEVLRETHYFFETHQFSESQQETSAVIEFSYYAGRV